MTTAVPTMIGDAVALHETGRPARANAKPSGSGSPGGLSTRQQRRQQRDAGEIRDDHADAGDLAELGDAAIVGRQERQEAGRDRGGRERQRRADVCAPRARARACRSSTS